MHARAKWKCAAPTVPTSPPIVIHPVRRSRGGVMAGVLITDLTLQKHQEQDYSGEYRASAIRVKSYDERTPALSSVAVLSKP